MTFKDNNHEQAYVWIWLPGELKPVVAGKIKSHNDKYQFVYGKSYFKRHNAISISPFELPLEEKIFTPQGINTMHNCLVDAGPDAWGQRILHYQFPKQKLTELDYLLKAGSNRIGALDFQSSSDRYSEADGNQPYDANIIENIVNFVEGKIAYSKDLAKILLQGTSIGGARPKCLVNFQGLPYIAKFSLSTDIYPIIKAEYIAMRLAKLVGIDVADVHYQHIHERDVLLVKRFDRDKVENNFIRKLMLSGLSLLGLNELEARYASYIDLADVVRKTFAFPKQQLHELFKRLSFNILVGNTDDHARNHSAFWDGAKLSLTPAYDICPQLRSGQEASQAMMIEGASGNLSTLANVLSVCETFLLSKKEAMHIIEQQIACLDQHWSSICEEVNLPASERDRLLGHVFRSEYSLNGLKSSSE